MKNTLFLFLLLAFVAVACEEKTDIQPQSVESANIAVDATITNIRSRQSVRITHLTGNVNQPAEPVTSAAVRISTSDSTWVLQEDSLNPGTYHTYPGFKATLPKVYNLLISYNGKVYTAKASMVVGLPVVKARFKQKSNGLYQITWVANPYNAKRPAMYELLLDWSGVSGYENAPEGTTTARMLYYSLPSLDVTRILAPESETIEFPAGTIITEKRYSLTAAHAEFIRGLLLETTWKGGYFDTAPGNVPTNLSQGAVGFFGACFVTSTQFVVVP
jgi:hypothetical protein